MHTMPNWYDSNGYRLIQRQTQTINYHKNEQIAFHAVDLLSFNTFERWWIFSYATERGKKCVLIRDGCSCGYAFDESISASTSTSTYTPFIDLPRYFQSTSYWLFCRATPTKINFATDAHESLQLKPLQESLIHETTQNTLIRLIS